MFAIPDSGGATDPRLGTGSLERNFGRHYACWCMALPGPGRTQPARNAMAGLLRGILQKYEVGGPVAVAGLPLLILLITKYLATLKDACQVPTTA